MPPPTASPSPTPTLPSPTPTLPTPTPNPVFVGGTGRSGTTWLAELLGHHPAVWSLPTESRFMVDPGGLEDLVRSLTEAYSPFHGWDALERLRATLFDDRIAAELGAAAGPERYRGWAERLLADLTWYAFDDRDTRRVVGRYFASRSELIALCRAYVRELFGTIARDHGKPIWCEKTPNNILAAPFLLELFPGARLVHIVRHPVQVAASHLSMPWAPDTIEDVCRWLEPMYRRWLASPAAQDPRCLVVRLEDLAEDWPKRRRDLFERLGLPDAETALGIDRERLAHWAPIAPEDERVVRRRLDFALDAFGYA